MNEQIQISGTITKEEYKKHSKYHRKKLQVRLCMMVSILSFISMIFVSFESDLVGFVLLTIVSAIMAVIGGILTFLLLEGISRWQINAEYKSDQIIKNKISYVFNEKGIEQRVNKSKSVFDWNELFSVYEEKELFQLYISKNKAILLPKTFFSSDEEIGLFRKMIRTYVEPEKIKRRKSSSK